MGVFPFLSVSRSPDGIATIKQQTIRPTTKIYRRNAFMATCQLPRTHVNNHYSTPPPIFMSNSSYGSFSFPPLHFLQE
ncbi:hypothetical protein T09_4456 [Trichinella sp. T9]|nr:hypothetical protein T09_4456 [Trichinella sp. T9]